MSEEKVSQSTTPPPVPSDAMRITEFHRRHPYISPRWLRESPEVERWKIANRLLVSESGVLSLASYTPPRPAVVAQEVTKEAKGTDMTPLSKTPYNGNLRPVVIEGLGMFLETEEVNTN